MGIRHLYSFITKEVPNGFFLIDITSEIEKWKRNHPGCKPIIFVHFAPFINGLFTNKMDILCGMAIEKNIRIVQEILEKFKNLDVELVFYQVAAGQSDMHDNKLSRQNQSFQDELKVVAAIRRGESTKEVVSKYEIHIFLILLITMKEEIKALILKFGFKYIRLTDKEIVAYAVKYNAVALIAENTDFFIYAGEFKYWSLNEFKYDRFETFEYNKLALRRHLNLNENQMPMFATMDTNNLIRYDDICEFLNKINHRKFYNIARMVNDRQDYPTSDGFVSVQLCRDIAIRLYGRNFSSDKIDLVKKSFDQFNINVYNEAPKTDDEQKDEMLALLQNTPAYKILLGKATCSTPYLMDIISDPEFQNYQSLQTHLYQSLSGIVLHHKNAEGIIPLMFLMIDGNFTKTEVPPKYPPFEIPPLLDLYNEELNDIEMEKRKFSILQWIFGDQVTYEKMGNFDPKYFSVVLTLIYLVKTDFISIAEADLFLYVAYMVYTDTDEVLRTPHPEYLNVRAMQLTFAYMKMRLNVGKLVCLVGLFRLRGPDHFEGKFFHKFYGKFVELSDSERIEMLGAAMQYRLYAESPAAK